MSLSFRMLRDINLRRCTTWHPNGGVYGWTLSDWAVASAGEMGEACNIVKKINRFRDSLIENGDSGNLVDLEAKLADELADTVIYLDLLAARAGINLAPAIVSKFNRTSVKNGLPQFLPLEKDE